MRARVVPGSVLRDVPLPDGRRLVVRAATSDDVDALVDLYERLADRDRRRRFFSGFHPDERFVRRLVERPEAKGGMLVVEVVPPGADPSELVAEAEYAVLPDGDGELAITVDCRWRGWLAPFLLDALLELAAERGVANLRADVLAENRPMLAMLRSRGQAYLDSDDYGVVDAVVSTTGDVPCWPDAHDRPRVLVEVPGGRWRLAPGLRNGFDVRGCSGPKGRPDGRCPLLEGRRCPLVDGADVVVVAHPSDDPVGAALLEAHGRAGTRHLVIDVRRGHPAGDVPAGAVILEDATAEEARAVVDELLGLDEDDSAQEERRSR